MLSSVARQFFTIPFFFFFFFFFWLDGLNLGFFYFYLDGFFGNGS